MFYCMNCILINRSHWVNFKPESIDWRL